MPLGNGDTPARIETSDDYIESLRDRNLKVFLFGELVDEPVNHPMIRPSINAVAATYDLAIQEPEVATVESSLTGKRVNRFLHVAQSAQDLVAQNMMQRKLGQNTGTCFQRCVGMDAFNALYSVTYEIDEKHRTPYHGRLKAFLTTMQERNYVVGGAMTDVKGDRSKAPHEQEDPEAAFPVDAPGITYIYGRQSCDTRSMEGGSIDVGNAEFSGQEAMVVLDDVFVPWSHVFMDGEHEFASMLVERFTCYHRRSYVCKTGVGDVLIGAAAQAAEDNGVDKASHIKDKLVQMTHLT
jgi:4-hydroxybutyryl-CoA dehydratase/vinylacetyl-CoA-Delta-isomerase